jgi:hypothetical protein
MKVSELIEILQKMPPDIFVMVDGYEGGITDLTPNHVEEVSVVLNEHKGCDYYGPHAVEEDTCVQPWEEKKPTVRAVLLSR